MISLGELSALAHALVEADRGIEAAVEELSTRKEAARQLREESIPAAMMELGLNEVKLDSGEKVTIKQDVYASIPAAQRDEAYAWLEAHGFGGLLKTEVVLHFTRGEKSKAEALMQELQSEGYTPELEQGVHAQTLKAFLREQLEAANPDLPLDLFGARPVWTTKIS